MCSIGEDDFGDEGGLHSMIKDEKPAENEELICKKCNVEKNVIKLSFKEAMCMSCFLTYVRHKFRASLGATKVIRSGSTVLLSFSGDSSSVCLLDMIKFGYEVESHKRLRFSLKVVFVDENCVFDDPVEKRIEKIQAVRRVFDQFQGFTCYYSSIASTKKVFEIQQVTADNIESLASDEEKFLKTFNSLKSLTSKQDFLAVTKNDNLRKIAQSLGCQYIFAPDVSISLAKRLISDMALGRGASAAFDVGFCDDRLEAIKIIRPIKDISPVEIDAYLKFTNLECLQINSFGADSGKFASLQNLTSNFIDDLQQNYSSTVSTVFRTSTKIGALRNAPSVQNQDFNEGMVENFKNLNVENINSRCYMCKAYLDYHNSDTLFAIEFSRLAGYSANDEHIVKNTEKIEEDATSAVNADGNSLKKHLCHGCRNIFIGLDDQEVEQLFL